MAIREFWQVGVRAGEVIEQHKITALLVDPFSVAKNENILCLEFEAIAPGMFGCLMKVGDKFGIFYSDRFSSDGFRRFTVAHELGHYFLPGHIEYLFSQGNERHESESGFISDDRYEREADSFAAALLMPEEVFRSVAALLTPG
jgi:Zn-dependent peptidase ImmA (M78 family)